MINDTELRLAMIGLDTSHAPAFARLLNDSSDCNYLPGGRIVKAWPGGSVDFELSRSRVCQFTEEVRQTGVFICDSIEETAADCDAILLESADGRVHLDQFKKLIPFGKPVFIDKPLACSLPEAKKIAQLAQQNNIPVMSSSSLRFLQGLAEPVARYRDQITAVELRGPLFFEETQPGYFWYGIHTIEMLFAILGPDYKHLEIRHKDQIECLRVNRKDGVTANLEFVKQNIPFSGTLTCGKQQIPLPSSDAATEPLYRSLLKKVLLFFSHRQTSIPLHETLKLIAFIEKANKLRLNQISRS